VGSAAGESAFYRGVDPADADATFAAAAEGA
jgi:hypothetical protein